MWLLWPDPAVGLAKPRVATGGYAERHQAERYRGSRAGDRAAAALAGIGTTYERGASSG